MTKRCLCPAALCFLSGIVFSAFGIRWAAAPAAVLLIFVFLRFFKFRMTIPGLLFTGALTMVFLAGVITGNQNNHVRSAYLGVLKDGQKLTVQGRLYKKETKSFRTDLYLDKAYVLLDTGPMPCRDIIVQAKTDGYLMGNTLVVTGRYEEFSIARNEGGFDERAYNYGRGVDIKLSHIRDIKEYGKQDTPRELLYRMRNKMKAVIEKALSESAAGTLSAMVLGDKTSLLPEDKSLFAEAGLSHILSVSGLHVSLLCMGLFGVLRKLKFPVLPAAGLVSCFAVIYCIFTGAGTATVRAVGMFLISMTAMVLGEAYDILSALSLLAIIIAAQNPCVIVTAGFLLSFGAVLGIAVTGRILAGFWQIIARRRAYMRDMRRKLKKDERRADGKDNGRLNKTALAVFERLVKYKEGLLTTVFMNLGIILTTLPMITWFYFEIPTLSLLLNLIIIPLMGVLLCLGFLGAAAGCVFFPAGLAALRPCEWILAFCRGTAGASLKLPFSTWIMGQPSAVGVAVYYAVLLALLFAARFASRMMEEEVLLRKKILPRTMDVVCRRAAMIYAAAVFVSVAVLSGILALSVPPCPNIAVLDVDQGDGIFIRTSDGTNVFIDGGSTGVKSVGKYRILPFLKYHGIGHIDYWFVSHADEDHVNGMEEMIEEGYDVRNLVVSKYIYEDDNTADLFAAAKAGKLKVHRMDTGDSLVCGGERFTCLFPAEDYRAADINSASLVLLYENMDFRMLLTGDMGKPEEKELMKKRPDIFEKVAQEDKPIILKTAHHGSKNSSDEEFLTALAPDIAVISAGVDNSYGHPHKDTLEKFEKIACPYFRTDISGELIIKFEDGAVKISGRL